MQHGDAIGQRLGLAAIVGDEHGGDAILAQHGAEIGDERRARRLSRLANGSSSSRTSGSSTSARASATRWASPPDSVRA